jgi:hypothetical protein
MNNGMNGRAGVSSTAMPVMTIHRGAAPARGVESEPSDGAMSAGSGSAGYGGAPSRTSATMPTASSPRAPSTAPGGSPR